MDNQNMPNEEQQSQLSNRDMQKQDSKDVVKAAGKLALQAHGVPPALSNMAVNKIANNPFVNKALNKATNNPLLQKGLNQAKPLADATKGGLPSKSPVDNGIGNGKGGPLPGGGGQADTMAKAANTAMKVKKYWPIISAVAPILGWILLAIIAVILIMVPILYIQQKYQQLEEGLDKFINFIIGQGWETSDVVFFNTLQREYDRYERTKFKEGEFDIPLIAATIHFSTVVNPDSYSYNGDDKDTEYNYNSDDPEIHGNQLRSFYVKANNELGSAFTLFASQKKLIGNLIDTKVSYECVAFPSGWEVLDPQKWEEFANLAGDKFYDFWQQIIYTISDTGEDIVGGNNIFNIIRLITSYHSQGGAGYLETEFDNFISGITNHNVITAIKDIVKNSEPPQSCGEKEIAVPVFKKFINYESYKKYLKETFLPNQQYAKCEECEFRTASDARKEELLDQWVEEIFDQRKTYNYLRGIPAENFTTVYIPGNPTLPFNISDKPNWRREIRRGFYDEKCYSGGKLVSNTGCPHRAVDLGLETGDPIYAVANGKVIATNHNEKSGLYVTIAHDVDGDGIYDYSTSYLHLSQILVSNGAEIGGGQLIGEAGSTGNSTGTHLHFAVKDLHTNTAIDPKPILESIEDGTPHIFSSLISQSGI